MSSVLVCSSWCLFPSSSTPNDAVRRSQTPLSNGRVGSYAVQSRQNEAPAGRRSKCPQVRRRHRHQDRILEICARFRPILVKNRFLGTPARPRPPARTHAVTVTQSQSLSELASEPVSHSPTHPLIHSPTRSLPPSLPPSLICYRIDKKEQPEGVIP